MDYRYYYSRFEHGLYRRHVVNVALPALQSGLGATIAEVQWVVEAYALLLAALLLMAGLWATLWPPKDVRCRSDALLGCLSLLRLSHAQPTPFTGVRPGVEIQPARGDRGNVRRGKEEPNTHKRSWYQLAGPLSGSAPLQGVHDIGIVNRAVSLFVACF